jgi:hypothetical protein
LQSSIIPAIDLSLPGLVPSRLDQHRDLMRPAKPLGAEIQVVGVERHTWAPLTAEKSNNL